MGIIRMTTLSILLTELYEIAYEKLEKAVLEVHKGNLNYLKK